MRSVLLNRTSVNSLLKRTAFYERMPEFKNIQNIPEPKKKCARCRKGRVSRNKYNAFVAVLPTLSEDAVTRLKRFLNADVIQFIGYNRRTKRTETIKL